VACNNIDVINNANIINKFRLTYFRFSAVRLSLPAAIPFGRSLTISEISQADNNKDLKN